jgi:hypothetical protein
MMPMGITAVGITIMVKSAEREKRRGHHDLSRRNCHHRPTCYNGCGTGFNRCGHTYNLRGLSLFIPIRFDVGDSCMFNLKNYVRNYWQVTYKY